MRIFFGTGRARERTDLCQRAAARRKLGLRRRWFQYRPGSAPHYDLTKGKRFQAIRLGAVEIDPADFRRQAPGKARWPSEVYFSSICENYTPTGSTACRHCRTACALARSWVWRAWRLDGGIAVALDSDNIPASIFDSA